MCQNFLTLCIKQSDFPSLNISLQPGVYDVTVGRMTSTVRVWPFQAAPAGSIQQVAYQAGANNVQPIREAAGFNGGVGTGGGGGILGGTSGLLVGGAIIGVTAGIIIAVTAS